MTTFGDILKQARKAKGLLQREVARDLDERVEGAHVWRWEAGKNLPTADRVARLIEILELDPAATWQSWGEAQLAVPPKESTASEVAEAVSAPVEEAVQPARGRRSASTGAKPARARAPRAR
jgi:transcriptional regulator with XRE-family HTH domain